MPVGEVLDCFRPCCEQNWQYFKIPFGTFFLLFIRFMFELPDMYTSWLSKSFVLVIADVSLSRNLECFGGLYTIPASIGLVLGSKILKNRFLISLANPPLDLKVTSFLCNKVPLPHVCCDQILLIHSPQYLLHHLIW